MKNNKFLAIMLLIAFGILGSSIITLAEETDLSIHSIVNRKYLKLNKVLPLRVIVENKGSDTINGYHIRLQMYFQDGNKLYNQSINVYDTLLFPGKWREIIFPSFMPVAEGWYNILVSADLTDTTKDKNKENNILGKTIVVLKDVPEKQVLVEKFTGAWCGNCPKADVILNSRLTKEVDFNLVSIHQGDPMEINDSYSLIHDYCQGYPSLMFDRYMLPDESAQAVINYRHWEESLYAQDSAATPVSLEVNPTYISETEGFKVDIKVDYHTKTFGNYRILLYMVNDEISNQSDDYDQTNYCDEDPEWPELNGLGEYIKGYSHKHVLTKIVSDPFGDYIVAPEVIEKGHIETKTYNVQYTGDLSSIRFVAAVLEEYSGKFNCEVLNSASVQAIPLSVPENNISEGISIFPNPASDFVYVNCSENAMGSVSIYNLLGEKVLHMESVDLKQPFNISGLQTGVYLVSVNAGGKAYSEKMIVK